MLLLAGCPSADRSSSGRAGGGRPDAAVQYADEMINHGIETLDRLEEFEAGEVCSQIVGRIVEMSHTRRLPAQGQSDPLLATCPEPEMLRQTVDRLNQWGQSQQAPADWKLDPLVRELPPSLADVPVVRDLGKIQFSVYDGFSLLEALWLRDLSQWARGTQADELQQARQLFDWVVRNIQLDADEPERVPLFPWETLLGGRGTAMERAWVYILLLRQQGIDAAVLAAPPARVSKPAGDPARQKGAPIAVRPWCVAVLAEQEHAKGLYLFDTNLGLPIPARDGLRLLSSPLPLGDGQGERAPGQGERAPGVRAPGAKQPAAGLDIRPATLAEVLADHAILDRLNFDPQHPYWVKAANLGQIVVLVEASPVYVAAKSRLMESLLAGAERVVLTTDPAAQAERMKAAANAAAARLWSFPYQVLQRRSQLGVENVGRRLDQMLPLFAGNGTPLFKGRILHLKGRFQGEPGAIECYQAARPATKDVLAMEPKLAAANCESILQMPPAMRPEDPKQAAAELAHWQTVSCLRGKHDASYWLGLIAAGQGDFPSAIDYFTKRTLDAAAQSPWMPGIHYNLGRTYEADGQPDRAVEEYLSGIRSPMHAGNLLRARWLKEVTAASQPGPEEKPPAAAPETKGSK
ncbi:MAG: transglutaminase-like domain-containing protein [Thermoguttaceae bacterium]